MKLPQYGFWSWVIIACGVIMFIWGVLKAFGIISTPLIIQALLYITGAVALIGFGSQIGKILGTIGFMQSDIKVLKGDTKDIKGDLNDIDKRLINLGAGFRHHLNKHKA